MTPVEPADAAAPDRPWMRRVRVLFVVAVAILLVQVIVRDADELRDVHFDVSPGWLALAVPLGLAAGVFIPLAWCHLVRASGSPLVAVRAIRIWWIAQTGRYIPTGVAAFVSRVVMANDEGVPRAATVTTMAIELAMLVGISAAIAVVALPGSFVAWWVGVALLGLVLLGMVALPDVATRVTRRIPRLAHVATDGWERRQLYVAEALFIANAIAKSVAFVFVARALVPVDDSDALLIIGAMNGGIVAGMVGVTPAGIGVREGVMASILTPHYGLGDAAALAIVLRVWEVAIECAWLGLVQLRPFRRAAIGT